MTNNTHTHTHTHICIYTALFYSSHSATCFSLKPIYMQIELEHCKVVHVSSYCAHCIKITRIRSTSGSSTFIEMFECSSRMHVEITMKKYSCRLKLYFLISLWHQRNIRQQFLLNVYLYENTSGCYTIYMFVLCI